jgi:HSP20 family protein
MHTKFKNYAQLEEIVAPFVPLFSNLFHEAFHAPINEVVKDEKKKTSTPPANILEKDGGYDILLSVPGFKKEDVSIKLEKNTLVITAEAKTQEGLTFKHKEFGFTGIKRSFNLSENIDQTSIAATVVNGILTISLKKKEEVQPKNIQVL